VEEVAIETVPLAVSLGISDLLGSPPKKELRLEDSEDDKPQMISKRV